MRNHSSQSQHLSPEFNKALSKLLTSMNTSYQIVESIWDGCVYQGNLQFIQTAFSSKTIPSSGNWRWNQAKSRKTVHIPGGQVTFFKLSPRKLHYCDATVPSYKLWKFCITLRDSYMFYCLWCEKGPTNAEVERRFGTHQEVSLQDFRFLASFMSPNVVSELWPDWVM
uniref:Uncharacterized protein n=1 Tax=Vannella robusta TaxID=1487602 RepID=A0A7S4HIC6_9EUKA|mmetsp:Transcript_1103/g.1348  ORF Transcript_1103/g.1348 Transcript_1103/m.1348 type:complete len:168 (+) Transcript_1103:314-817(+)